MGAAILLAVGLSACSSGGGSEGSSAITKAEFVKKAALICKRGQEERFKALAVAAKSTKPGAVTKAQQEQAIVDGMLPAYRKMTAELAELTTPEGEEEKVDEVIAALEKTADRIESEPLNGDLEEVRTVAAAYGIPECGE